jgi:hypothetical protein
MVAFQVAEQCFQFVFCHRVSCSFGQ